MRYFISVLALASLAACSGGSGDGFATPASCSNDGQKQFVLDNLYAWYLWNDMLPANISIADYASPEELVTVVTQTFGPQSPTGGPLDRFSSVGSLAADQQFFGEGKFEGFGFSWRIENDEMRFTRVFVDSPANTVGGFERGQTVLTIDGRTIADIRANEGINAALDNATVEFEIRNLDTSTYTVSVTKDIVTINPIPQWRVIDMGPGVPPVGYMEFATFVSTAHDGLENNDFDNVFSEFIAAGVEDVIIDLRYNGGGLVETANILGDHLGGFANDGQIFSNTEFNADRAGANNSIDYFANRANAIDINRLIVVASRRTASASELVINGLDPFVNGGVYIVGDNTFGKPVGQVGIDFCEKILRPTAFKKSNAAGFGDYFDGLPVDCVATDDLAFATGANDDPNIVAAMSFLNGVGCPVVAAPGGQQKATYWLDEVQAEPEGRPEREFAGAF
ncbi:MAG: S41 family peptidase [Gammaproteobacteria bacterium]|nr:S41 family peptidase [Gammaproteobacteria bacterium]